MQVAGRNVVITGASQGIGEQLARSFAARGATVLAVARSADRLAALSEQIGGRWLAADLTDEAQLDGLVARCLAELGTIDVWVNNAGAETADAFVHVDRPQLRNLARLNFEAPILLTRDLLPHLLARHEGHIVMLSSLAGTIPFPGLTAYAGTKAGLTHFSESLRLELKDQGIGITVVAPGAVANEMWGRVDHDQSWARPAIKRFARLRYLPKIDQVALAEQIVDAVERDKRHVRPKNRYQGHHLLSNAPRRMVELALTGVRNPPLRLADPDAAGGGTGEAPVAWSPIWPTDNPPSRRWPLYTRGNIGEVFPEVVLPLTWDTFGGAAERGWQQAYREMGLLMPEDFAGEGDKVILGVFGGYGYINASFVRLLGVRAPGGSVEVVDRTFFGESDAPAYRPRPGDRNVQSSLRLGRTVLRLLGTKALPELEGDRALAAAYVDRYPGDDAEDAALLEYFFDLEPVFERLFARHIAVSFSGALISGALADLCAKAGKADLLVSILSGIGEVESAAPSAAMWALARAAQADATVAAAFDAGVAGLPARLRDAGDAGPAWLARFDAFLAEFGSRGPNEWDIGSDPWALRPELALAAIDRMRGAGAGHDPAVQAAALRARREAAVADVRSALNPIDRLQFDKALRATTVLSQGRERTKSTIIRAVHGARTAQAELARRIAERGGPLERWHTCLYTRDEFPQAVDDPSTLADAIAERVARHATLSNLIPPFIIDDGVVPDPATWAPRHAPAARATVGERFTGIAGCPGVARGRARVVLDAAEPGGLGPGDVLVAPITDPSWTPLFLAAEAVVVDVGAMMSHAVIVSRELGIPCVVSAVSATQRIPDGALIEVDGSTGVVTVLEVPAAVRT